MILADRYFKETLQKILIYGQKDINPRPKYKDGTPAHSYFISPIFETYDLSKGEFPIITLRNTAIKMGIKEMLVIYQKQVNNQEGFIENGVNWWESWMNEQGNLGRAYSHNLESHRPDEQKRTVVKIKPKIIDLEFSKMIDIPKIPIEKSIDNVIYKNKYRNYGDYIIVKKYTNGKRTFVTCQFLNTGFKTDIRLDSINTNKQNPKNNLIRTNLGIGYIDKIDDLDFSKSELKILSSIWNRMIRRCNDADNHINTYNKIFVHNKWHSFRNFLLDVKYLPQYHLAKEDNFKNWELDKDYYGSNCYSKETCVFLNKQENIIYRSTQIKPIKIIDENGKIFYELSYTSLGKTLGLSKGYTKVCVLRGYYKNLKFEILDDTEYKYRYELSRNQVNELLKGLIENPYSRRHMISLWNWANIDKKELVECAFQTLFTVRRNQNNKYILDMTLIQRSSDYITAKTINSTQYVAFQMMVAKHCGYELGKFNHFIQNVHIYDRHLDALKELLEKEPLDVQPILHLKNNKNFYDYSINDFEIIGTENITKIKSPLELAI